MPKFYRFLGLIPKIGVVVIKRKKKMKQIFGVGQKKRKTLLKNLRDLAGFFLIRVFVNLMKFQLGFLSRTTKR